MKNSKSIPTDERHTQPWSWEFLLAVGSSERREHHSAENTRPKGSVLNRTSLSPTSRLRAHCGEEAERMQELGDGEG